MDENFPEFVKLVNSVTCKSKDHLKEFFDEIIAKGGEGAVLHEPRSFYKIGPSLSLKVLQNKK